VRRERGDAPLVPRLHVDARRRGAPVRAPEVLDGGGGGVGRSVRSARERDGAVAELDDRGPVLRVVDDGDAVGDPGGGEPARERHGPGLDEVDRAELLEGAHPPCERRLARSEDEIVGAHAHDHLLQPHGEEALRLEAQDPAPLRGRERREPHALREEEREGHGNGHPLRAPEPLAYCAHRLLGTLGVPRHLEHARADRAPPLDAHRPQRGGPELDADDVGHRHAPLCGRGVTGRAPASPAARAAGRPR
jgi:hypothetical protein